MIRPRHLIGTAVLAGAFTAPGCLSLAAAAVPNCGGQSAPPQPVPYQCNLPGIDITSQGVTRHFAAQVVADGTRVTVTYLMTGGLLPVDVPIRIVHHEGISGAGGTEDTAQGFIKAGTNTAILVDSAPCRNGQLDVKAVFIGNGESQGRVGGPWIQNGTGCNQSSTTTTPSSSSVPPSTSGTTPTPPSPTAPSTPSTVEGGTSSRALPATGSNTVWMMLGAFAFILIGTILITRRVSS